MRCEHCGRRVFQTRDGLCGYCVHALTTEGERAAKQLEAEGILPVVVQWTETQLKYLTFYRQEWAKQPVEAR